MANRNTTGFGLIAVGTIGSTPATQGQGKYYIDAAYELSSFIKVQCRSVKSRDTLLGSSMHITDKTIGVLNGIIL